MRFTTLCGGLYQTAYSGTHCSHAVHSFIRKHSTIHRSPQIRISDKPSHRGHRPLLFPKLLKVYHHLRILLVFSKIFLAEKADLLADISLHALSAVANRQMYDP